ncbi:MAG: BON domain-containing protein [Wenzhouxiangellaceae bacterium]
MTVTCRAGIFMIMALVLMSIAGCQALWGNESAQPAAQATVQAVRIKALFLEEPDLAGSAIAVEFEAGRVVLAGFVETQEQRQRAETIAAEQDGVDEVVNRIEVK